MKHFEERLNSELFTNISFFSTSQWDIFQSAQTDSTGNHHFINPGNGDKIQIIFKIDPTGVLIGQEEEDGNYNISVLGNEKRLTESILYEDKNPLGILCRINEQWKFEKITTKDNLLGKILTQNIECVCKGTKLYASNLSELIALELADFIINENHFNEKYIDFTVWNSSLSGENGLFSAIKMSDADKIVFISLESDESFSDNSSPAIVFKDGNYVLPLFQRSTWTFSGENNNFYVGKTGKTMEYLDIQLYHKKLLGIYLPVSHYESRVEQISLSILQKTHDLLLKCIAIL